MTEMMDIVNKRSDKLQNERDRYMMVNQLNREQPLNVVVKIEPKPVEWIPYWIVTIVSASLWTFFVFIILEMLRTTGKL